MSWSPSRSIIAATKPGTSSGTSQLVTYAASTSPGSAFSPARSPSSGPRPSRSSRVTITAAGSSGSACSGAATTTSGETTVPSSRTTRCSIVSGPNGSSAFGDPIRVDLPPHRTMPPVVIDDTFMPRRAAQLSR